MKRVVLVRPSGPRNVGSLLRSLANFGPGELFLVAPQRRAILLHPDFEQMAHGVEDMARRVTVVEHLSEALCDCTHAVGFSARNHQHRLIRSFSSRRLELAHLAAREDQRLALVFGSEASGLASEEAELCQELVHIATSSEHTSLNLASCAAIVLHSLFEASGADQAPSQRLTRGNPISGFAREFLIARVRKVFVGAAWTERAKRDIHQAVERVLRHAEIESRDARAWNQAMRALGDESQPSDFGLARQAVGLPESLPEDESADEPGSNREGGPAGPSNPAGERLAD
jgi:TrmH family RNA methyltransferase